MSDVKRLIIGIALVFIGLTALLSATKGIIPYVGGGLGLIGCYMTVKVIFTGHLK